MKLIDKAEKYIKRHDLDTSAEELFIEFQEILELHSSFNTYLKKENLNEKLEKMQRNKRLIEKRKLFIDWYSIKNQNNKMVKEILIDLSEMVFASTKTVQKDLLKEATGLNN